MNRISAVLITHNEAEKIQRALKSLEPVADEIVLVDSFSSDGTPDLCQPLVDQLIQRKWQGYRDQKQFAVDQASHDWVLSLDGDEALSPELAREILQWKQSDPGHEGYRIPRKAYFMGRWIRHTTWYPDWQLRLFKKTAGCWEGGRVHESFQVRGSVGRLRGEIHHFTYDSISEYLHQLERFSGLAALDQWERGKRTGWTQVLFSPPAVFLKNYLLHRGFLDGVPGLVISLLAGTSSLFKCLKLMELQSNSRPAGSLSEE